MNQFFHGAACVFEGISIFYRDKSLWKFTFFPWLFLLATYTGVAALILHFSRGLSRFLVSQISSWPEFVRTLLEGSLTLLAVLLAILIIFTTLSTLFEIFGSLFFDRLLEAFEKKHFQTSFPELPLKTQFRFTLEGAWFGLKTTLLFFILLMTSFIPVAGPILLVIIMGIRMGYALLFAPGFLRAKSIAETRQLLNKREVAGFGITAYLLQLVPLLLPVILPGMILGAAILYNASCQQEKKVDRTS